MEESKELEGQLSIEDVKESIEDKKQEEGSVIVCNNALEEYTNCEKERLKVKEELKALLESNAEFVLKMNAIKQKEADIDARELKIKDTLTTNMPVAKKKNITNGIYKVTFVDATTKSTFDSKKLKEEDLKTYEKYVKVSDVSAYVKLAMEK